MPAGRQRAITEADLTARRGHAFDDAATSVQLLRQVAFEIHGGVENADDLQDIVVRAEEDHVPAFGGDPTSGEKILPETETMGIRAERFEAGPEVPELPFLLSRTPGFQRVGADGTKVVEGRRGEAELHA